MIYLTSELEKAAANAQSLESNLANLKEESRRIAEENAGNMTCLQEELAAANAQVQQLTSGLEKATLELSETLSAKQ